MGGFWASASAFGWMGGWINIHMMNCNHNGTRLSAVRFGVEWLGKGWKKMTGQSSTCP